jgi:serine/threonine protein phosphatase 1
MSRTFVMGDIHGAYRALLQCLEISGFNYEADRLIFLGDVADGWPDTKLCIDELLKIKNLEFLFGNHDYWALDWMINDSVPELWFKQGGEATIKSYQDDIPEAHIELLTSAKPYIVEDNKLFVHAGIDPYLPLQDQDDDTFLWDRTFAVNAIEHFKDKHPPRLTSYDEVYVGHTPIPFHHPIQCCEVWLMDTGAGWSGVLSMMNVETKEIFTSDLVPSLYPGVKGRTKNKY